MRTARGVMAGSVAILVALFSHVLGGGAVPGRPGIIVPWVLSLMVCVMLDGRRLSLARLSVSVVLSQLLFHALFVLGTASDGMSAGGSGGMTAAGHAGLGAASGHGLHSAGAQGSGGTYGAAVSGPGAHGHGALHGDITMWVWHGIAAALTIVVLYRGERTLSRLCELAGEAARWVRHRFGVVPAVVPRAPAARALLPLRADYQLHPDPHLSERRRRGPPTPLVGGLACGRSIT